MDPDTAGCGFPEALFVVDVGAWLVQRPRPAPLRHAGRRRVGAPAPMSVAAQR